jgi:hypothetical protein
MTEWFRVAESASTDCENLAKGREKKTVDLQEKVLLQEKTLSPAYVHENALQVM